MGNAGGGRQAGRWGFHLGVQRGSGAYGEEYLNQLRAEGTTQGGSMGRGEGSGAERELRLSPGEHSL